MEDGRKAACGSVAEGVKSADDGRERWKAHELASGRDSRWMRSDFIAEGRGAVCERFGIVNVSEL